MSREDTGAFRCSDIDRNLLVATTGVLGVTLDSIHERSTMSSSRPRQRASPSDRLEERLFANDGEKRSALRPLLFEME